MVIQAGLLEMTVRVRIYLGVQAERRPRCGIRGKHRQEPLCGMIAERAGERLNPMLKPQVLQEQLRRERRVLPIINEKQPEQMCDLRRFRIITLKETAAVWEDRPCKVRIMHEPIQAAEPMPEQIQTAAAGRLKIQIQMTQEIPVIQPEIAAAVLCAVPDIIIEHPHQG